MIYLHRNFKTIWNKQTKCLMGFSSKLGEFLEWYLSLHQHPLFSLRAHDKVTKNVDVSLYFRADMKTYQNFSSLTFRITTRIMSDNTLTVGRRLLSSADILWCLCPALLRYRGTTDARGIFWGLWTSCELQTALHNSEGGDSSKAEAGWGCAAWGCSPLSALGIPWGEGIWAGPSCI